MEGSRLFPFPHGAPRPLTPLRSLSALPPGAPQLLSCVPSLGAPPCPSLGREPRRPGVCTRLAGTEVGIPTRRKGRRGVKAKETEPLLRRRAGHTGAGPAPRETGTSVEVGGPHWAHTGPHVPPCALGSSGTCRAGVLLSGPGVRGGLREAGGPRQGCERLPVSLHPRGTTPGEKPRLCRKVTMRLALPTPPPPRPPGLRLAPSGQSRGRGRRAVGLPSHSELPGG